MKLINNRFRVYNIVNEGTVDESYIIKDLQDEEKLKFLTIYHGTRDKRILDYFITEFETLVNVNNRSLVKLEEFELVETINLKKAGSLMYYYVLNEYVEGPKLHEVRRKLDLEACLKVILDLMCVMDYLHFRGYSYKLLSPTNIFLTKDNQVKIKDLATITRDYFYSHYNDLTELFIAPELFRIDDAADKYVDYYSLGMLMKYLLFQGLHMNVVEKNVFRFPLTDDQKALLTDTITNLTHKDPTLRNISLRDHIKNILTTFNLDYECDLIKERDQLVLNAKIVGREKEINTLLEIDESLAKGIKRYNSAIISGGIGSGRSKLLGELAFRFRLRNRTVIHLKGRESLSPTGLTVSSLLKASFKHACNEIILKYSDDFNELLGKDKKVQGLGQKSNEEKFRIVNRLIDFYTDLTMDNVVYILIDDIYMAEEDLLNFINYLANKMENNRIFPILATIDPVMIRDESIRTCISSMLKDESILHMELSNLNEEETHKFVRNILGSKDIPKEFSTFIYRESLGNPNYIYFIIRDLYNRKELYLSPEGVWETRVKDYDIITISIDENQLIKRQLESLSEEEHRVLECIAISKDMTTKQLLLSMLDMEEVELDRIIATLMEEKIVDDKFIDTNEILSIYNIELKRLVYSRIDEDRRLKLHKLASKAIMAQYTNLKFIMDELIHHLKNSNQMDTALKLVLEEANRQKNKYTSYSIFLWENAYQLAINTDDEYLLEILDTLIYIYQTKGYTDLLGEYINKLHRLAIERQDLEYIIKAKHHQVEVYFAANQLDIAENLIKEMEEIIGQNPHLIEAKILLFLDKAKISYGKSKLNLLEGYLLKALKLSEEEGVTTYLGHIYNLYGIYKYLVGQPEEAIELLNRSIAFYESQGNPVDGIIPINNLGNIYADVYGRDQEALKYFRKGYEIATKFEFIKLSSVFSSNIGDMYYRNFKFEEALKYFLKSRELSNSIGEYRGIILSNINLGMVYIRMEKLAEADKIYNYVKDLNNKEPILDSGILVAYYSFMGKYHYHYGKYEEALKFFQQLSQISKDFVTCEYIIAQTNIQLINGYKFSVYNRENLEKIIDGYRNTLMNNLTLELLLRIAVLAIGFEDYDFAREAVEVYKKNNAFEDEDLSYLRITIEAVLDPSTDKLTAIENFKDRVQSKEYRLYIYWFLAQLWFKYGDYKRAIGNILKALNNLMKRAEKIQDKFLRYHFIKKRNGDRLKEDLRKYIKYQFKKDISYRTLDEAYRQDKRYNDLVDILKQLSLDEYRLIHCEAEYEKIDSLEALISQFTFDDKRNLDLILNFLGYETLATRGFIISYDEEEGSYTILSSLKEGDEILPRENLLIQSKRSSIGILLNRNFKHMEDSKYIDLLPEDVVSLICVPLFIDDNLGLINERRKKSPIKKYTSFEEKKRLYVYLESDSYLNCFEYQQLMLIKKLKKLIYLNAENRYLKEITIIDKLTGVLTRKFFDQQLEDLIEEYSRQQGSFTLLMVDIDNFKAINDTYGHLVGDDILSIIGQKLRNSIRSTDLVARYGGEEFIVILLDTHIEEGLAIAEKIRKSIFSIKIPEVERQISVCIGLSQFPVHGQFKKELINKADQALYHAKTKKGKNNTVVWTIDMGEGSNSQDKLEGILTGNPNRDNVNISAILSIATLVENNKTEEEKVALFTRELMDLLGAEYSTFIKYEED
ncbi:MAG: diguanylate cyclase [Tissierellia bacterium]|nr:diguanylate cyclase [Tissierellia bacterium]